jgi:hypothetical protein
LGCGSAEDIPLDKIMEIGATSALANRVLFMTDLISWLSLE